MLVHKNVFVSFTKFLKFGICWIVWEISIRAIAKYLIMFHHYNMLLAVCLS